MKEDEKELKILGGKAAAIIHDALVLNDIAFGIGMDAIQCVYAYAFIESGMSYEHYCEALDMLKKGYAKLWGKNV